MELKQLTILAAVFMIASVVFTYIYGDSIIGIAHAVGFVIIFWLGMESAKPYEKPAA